MRIYIYFSSIRVHIDTRVHVDVHGQAFISFGSMSVLAVEATALQHFGVVNKGIRVLGTSFVVMRNRSVLSSKCRCVNKRGKAGVRQLSNQSDTDPASTASITVCVCGCVYVCVWARDP